MSAGTSGTRPGSYMASGDYFTVTTFTEIPTEEKAVATVGAIQAA
ncbi:uncharacterized protein RAG0_06589 [Rhynchosporium agropyri]|uniref:Uncharacterized protein n=2 Tax=Rhynchosporium TaxID=38037 RepID=A0A1E1MAH8_RHYSE|nr:uncharacterized protein RAG0_06589 [Rhynchosporium agropyri]CZT46077.1 uncharacterized protein RSE6_06456 [Rhynchosporium secalis]